MTTLVPLGSPPPTITLREFGPRLDGRGAGRRAGQEIARRCGGPAIQIDCRGLDRISRGFCVGMFRTLGRQLRGRQAPTRVRVVALPRGLRPVAEAALLLREREDDDALP